MNSWFLSQDALSVERYGLVKNAFAPHSSISWKRANSGPLSLRLIPSSCPILFFPFMSSLPFLCVGAAGKDMIAKNREKKKKEGQGGRAVAITQSSNTRSESHHPFAI